MNPSFHIIDFVIVGIYAILLVGVGLWVSRTKKGHTKTAEDYFLASKALPWWAIGSSLIAANISAEQFIGMSGSGFAGGLAIASYEFMAALTLIIVGKFFLPIFIKQGIYTIPEFVEKRFSTNLKTILAVFWIALFVFVNLTSVLFLGGKAIDTIVGVGDGSMIVPAIIALAIFRSSLLIIWRIIGCSLDRCHSGCSASHRWYYYNLNRLALRHPRRRNPEWNLSHRRCCQ